MPERRPSLGDLALRLALIGHPYRMDIVGDLAADEAKRLNGSVDTATAARRHDLQVWRSAAALLTHPPLNTGARFQLLGVVAAVYGIAVRLPDLVMMSVGRVWPEAGEMPVRLVLLAAVAAAASLAGLLVVRWERSAPAAALTLFTLLACLVGARHVVSGSGVEMTFRLLKVVSFLVMASAAGLMACARLARGTG